MAKPPRYPIAMPEAVPAFSLRWFRLKARGLLRRAANPDHRASPAGSPNWLERAFWIAAFAGTAFLGAWLLLSIDLAVVGLITLAVAALAFLVSRLSRAARLWWLFRLCVLTILAMAARSTLSGRVDGTLFGVDVSIAFGQPPGMVAYLAAISVTVIVWIAAERASS